MHGGRVRQVVGRYVHGLNGRNSPGLGVGNALLQLRQLGGQRGLVAQARRHLAQQARYFHPRLNETEDVVNQQQYIALLLVAEVFGHREGGVAHPETCSGWLVHLAKYHHHVFEHAGRFHVFV